jgi:hypothetical protein
MPFMPMRAAFVLASLALATASAEPQAPATPPPVPECREVAAAISSLLANDARNRDWPNLARYREQNRRLTAAAGDTRVVFMGDSITDLWQQPHYGGFFPGKPYVDRGISGQTTPQMLVRFRQDVIDLKPRLSSSSRARTISPGTPGR